MVLAGVFDLRGGYKNHVSGGRAYLGLQPKLCMLCLRPAKKKKSVDNDDDHECWWLIFSIADRDLSENIRSSKATCRQESRIKRPSSHTYIHTHKHTQPGAMAVLQVNTVLSLPLPKNCWSPNSMV
jgi:hypothetical protein